MRAVRDHQYRIAPDFKDVQEHSRQGLERLIKTGQGLNYY
jgi:hypothetical protein